MTRGLYLIVAALVLALLVPIVPLPTAPARALVLGDLEDAVYALPVRSETARVNKGLEVEVLNLLNQTRVATGLVPLMPHATIQKAAQDYGLEMFAQGYLSHRSLDGRTPWERVRDLGVRVRFVGENLAYAVDVRQAYAALMASPPHRRNILYPNYRLIGIGVIDGGKDGVIVVQDFTGGVSYPLARWWVTSAVAMRSSR